MSTPIYPPLCLRPSALDVPVPDVAPMRWNGASMDAAKFRTLPRVPGYRYELLDGTARIRPVDQFVLVARDAGQRAELVAPHRDTVWARRVHLGHRHVQGAGPQAEGRGDRHAHGYPRTRKLEADDCLS